jgi:hypothetical protein
MPASSEVRSDDPYCTAEQVMRQEPQLGAGQRREHEKKSKTRNENNSYNLHSQLKRNLFRKLDREFADSAAQK